jgi:peptidoglycan/xylan/chitin deacetylase (PgdA/CDA1 family)
VRSPRILSSLFYVGLDALGIPQAVRQSRRAATILCYHNVVPDGAAAASATPDLHTPLAAFESQVGWLARHYEIVRLRELVERIARGERLYQVAALTFDDGYLGVFQHAWPVLARLGIPATIFVVAEAPSRWDSFWWDHPDVPPSIAPTRLRYMLEELWDDEHAIPRAPWRRNCLAAPQWFQPAGWQVIAAAARQGVEIGVHSATHRRLPRLTDAELEREVIMSREVIQRETGVAPAFFSYPYGMWDERVKAAVRAAGYRAAVTVDPGLNGAGADPWALRRVTIPAKISEPAFRAYAAGLNPRWALR